MSVATITDSLVAFYDLATIREIWKTIFEAQMRRVQLPLQVNARSREGTSSSAIIVSTQQEAEAYVKACQAAIARIDPDATGVVSADTLGATVDFSHRQVLV